MRFSEAIRLGALLGPQIHGSLLDESNQGTCALGSAALALGIMGKGWPEPLGEFLDTFQRCPVCEPTLHGWLRNIIAHLNDSHNWTRERIAGFVQSIEAQREGMHHENDPASAVESMAEARA